MLIFVSPKNRYYDSFLPMEKRELMENYQDLYDMVQAVEQGDAAKSKSIAQSHIRRFTEYMETEKKQVK